MTYKDFKKIAEQYKKKDRAYSDLLFYIQTNCQDDFLTLFKRAESEGKKLFLINGYPELRHTDLLVEAYIELADIGVN